MTIWPGASCRPGNPVEDALSQILKPGGGRALLWLPGVRTRYGTAQKIRHFETVATTDKASGSAGRIGDRQREEA
ncbi:hypothetical protein GCM10027081_60880 [Cupriavidus yeoncheonensis]